MSNPTFSAKVYSDFLTSLEGGQNSGVSPLLLDRNQFSFGINLSLRKGYAKCRPPVAKKILDFGGNSVFQNIVEAGVFQGGGYYRPDYGTESLLAQIAGRLIKFTENGNSWTVSDVSIPDDLNDPTTAQAWMWQSEKWLIVSDGTTKLPIFFDGTTSRRSYGPSVELGEAITFLPANPPAIGETVAVTLTDPYAGPFNVPVLFNGEYYQPVESATGYDVVIKNVSATGGTLIPAGTDIVVTPAAITTSIHIVNADPISAVQTFVNDYDTGVGTPYVPTTPLPDNGSGSSIITGKWKLPVGTIINITLDVAFPTVPTAITIGMTKKFDQLYFGQSVGAHRSITLNTFWDVIAVSSGGLVLTVKLRARTDGVVPPAPAVAGTSFYGQREGYYWDSTQASITAIFNSLKTEIQLGQSIGSFSTPQPSFVLGKTVANFNIPNVGNSITIQSTVPYTGAANQPVTISVAGMQISQPPINPPSSDLILINLTDTSAGPYVNPTEILSVPELPPARMGAYGMGRNWFSLTDGISYYAGDIVGGGAGTPANDFRDSVLKTTENDFLAGGGKFRLPGSGDIINSMRFTANLDASLGQGPLQIGTPFSFFSNNSPVDRTLWAAMTNPIQSESLIGNGSTGQNSTILVNSDLFFRSLDGWGSLVLARRDFNTWGNRTISNEMQRPLDSDDQGLLSYGSAVNYQNRFVGTCAPLASAQGVIHQAAVVLNFDLISSLRKTLPPSWEGIWTGLNILQVITGRVNGSVRSFAFTLNLDTNKIELYEFLSEKSTQYLDNGVTPIKWCFETKAMFNEDVKPLTELIQLRDGECYLSNIKGSAHVKIMYRPDYMQCWTTWREFDVCATTGTKKRPGYRSRIGFGEPSGNTCEPGNNRPLRVGFFFQFRIEITGSCTFNALRIRSVTTQQPEFAPVECEVKPCQDLECDLPDDLQFYALQGLPPAVPDDQPAFFPFHNTAQTLAACPDGIAQFTNQPPSWITVHLGDLTVKAGTFGGQTQTEANNKALSALNKFITDNLTSGNMTCFAVACTFTPSTLTGVLLNTAYSQQLRLAGVIQGAWSIGFGTLPTGLTLDASGLLHGTPTQAGTFSIVVHVSGDGIDCNWPYTFLVYENMLTNFIEYFTLNETGSSNRASTGGAVSQPFFSSGGGAIANVAGVLGNAFLDSFPTGGNFLTGLNALLNPQECFNGVSFSLSIWVNRLTAITGTAFLWTNRKFETEGCQLYFDTPTQFKFDVRNNLGVTNASTYVTLPNTNQWYHYTVTFNTTTQVLLQYLNGVLFSTQTGFLRPTMTNPSRRMAAGIVFGGGGSPMFAMQAIGIWNTVLTSNQILHLYNGGSGIAYPF